MSHQDVQAASTQLLDQLERAIVGKRSTLQLIVTALLADGHVLLEDVPGVAKTVTARSLAEAAGLHFSRVQFTPDLIPADITGSAVFTGGSVDGGIEFRPGPIFANLVLGDEINRAPPKTQSALLEAMEERQVTVDGETRKLPDPFMVIGTQNPIESEGTYPLPEAQLDRFMMKVVVGYPTPTEEFVIVERMTGSHEQTDPVIDVEELKRLQAAADEVYVDPALIEYSVQLVNATRNPAVIGYETLARYITHGASPRASINLILAGKALAFVRGRNYALPQDVRDLALDVLRHRLVLSYEALADGVRSDDILSQILHAIPLPEVPLNERTNTILGS